MKSIIIERAQNGFVVKCGNSGNGESIYSVLEVYETVPSLLKAIEKKVMRVEKKAEKEKIK